MQLSSPRPIVIVDDEKSYTELLTAMLAENLDCPVLSFDRPRDALRQLPVLNPGVIVTDYYMPQLDGLDFIREATPVVPDAAFVLITGHNLAAYQEQMARLTALRGFLPKPFGWRTLADEVLRVWPAQLTAPSFRVSAAPV